MKSLSNATFGAHRKKCATTFVYPKKTAQSNKNAWMKFFVVVSKKIRNIEHGENTQNLCIAQFSRYLINGVERLALTSYFIKVFVFILFLQSKQFMGLINLWTSTIAKSCVQTVNFFLNQRDHSNWYQNWRRYFDLRNIYELSKQFDFSKPQILNSVYVCVTGWNGFYGR